MRIPNRVRYWNKKFLNRFTIKIAGRRQSPIAWVRHTGRKSGKVYKTPIMVSKCVDGFLFALTYGPEVDWYKNLKASGSGVLGWHGMEYVVSNPVEISGEKGCAEWQQPQRTLLRWIKMDAFFYMTSKIANTKQ